MIKIVHFQLFGQLTGVQRVCLDELRLLNTQFKYSLLLKEAGPFAMAARALDVDVKTLPKLKREICLGDLYRLIEIFYFLKQNNFDVIHTHSSKPGLLGRVAGKLAGLKTIHTVHGFGFPGCNWLGKIFVYIGEFIASRFTDILIVMNTDDRMFANKWLLIPDYKIKLIYNAAFSDRLIPIEVIPQKYSSDFHFIFIGRLDRQKSVGNIFEFMEKLENKYLLEVVGEKTIDNLDFISSEHVEFLGWIDNPCQMYEKNIIYISLSSYEGCPLSVIEALCCGAACILSKISGHKVFFDEFPEAVFSGDTFELHTFTEEIMRLDRHRLALKARSFFSDLQRTKSIKTIYKSLC